MLKWFFRFGVGFVGGNLYTLLFKEFAKLFHRFLHVRQTEKKKKMAYTYIKERLCKYFEKQCGYAVADDIIYQNKQ